LLRVVFNVIFETKTLKAGRCAALEHQRFERFSLHLKSKRTPAGVLLIKAME